MSFPHYPVPDGETMDSFLAKRVEEGVRRRYGSPAKRNLLAKARAQVEHELKLIAKLGFAGYFLIVWDLIRYCQQHGILVQGRGSAANSAVCYALEITAVDPVGMELLFERFLSESRGEWPDIDLDLPSGRSARTGDSIRLRALWATGRGDDRQRDQLSRQVRGARGGQGAGLRCEDQLARLSAWWATGSGAAKRHHGALTFSRPASTCAIRASRAISTCACACRTCRGIWASTRAAW
jgi:hypothetical protein